MDRKPYSIALVIKTEGLEYDDRVRKEIISVRKLFPNIKFKIFVMLNNDNRNFEGITSYGIPFKAVYLKSREMFGSAKGVILKSYEFYHVIKKDLKQFDAIWCADRHCFMVAALSSNKRILWDLHEIPYEFIGNKLLECVLRYILNKCKVVVHANPQRCEYMHKLGLIANVEKHYALRNYPNFDDVDPNIDELYCSFLKWKADRPCVYLQGLNNDGRASYESVESVLRKPKLCAVIVGGFDPVAKDRLLQEYGELLEQRLFFAGKIPQLKIPQYVGQCILSMVFYKNIRPNNFYCEANRFYQSVIMGLPVVVGNNPPMKEIVEKYGFGISIDDDGSNIEKISAGLEEVLHNYELYKNNNNKHKDQLYWDSQDSDIKKIINTLFS